MSTLRLTNRGYKLQKSVRLIGIVGNAHTGKDSLAKYLANSLDATVYIHPFAWFLKGCASEAFGIPFDNFVSTVTKEQTHPFWGVSPREVAQYVGTEMFRALDSDFWIYRLIGHIDGDLELPEAWEAYSDGDVLLIPDVRFENEVEFILANNGHLIHLTRPGEVGNVGIPGHESEAGISSSVLASLYHIHNGGTLEELYLEVDKFIDKFFADDKISQEE